jgi:hypothetical protein
MQVYNQDKKYVRKSKYSQLTVEQREALRKLYMKKSCLKRYHKHYKVKAKRKPYEHSAQWLEAHKTSNEQRA